MKPDIKINLNGREYCLRMTVRSLINIEEELGKPITQMGNDISIKSAATFVRHALRTPDNKPVPQAEWDAILDEVDVSELFDAMSSMMDTLNPKEEEAPGKNE